MILHKTIDVECQIKQIIDGGWYQDARNVVGLTAQHGMISRDAFDRFMRVLAGKPATASPGHELYGCMVGFDSNTVVSSLQFERLTTPADMKRAFKQAVNKIEIETSSQCNRHCAYCPNSRPDLEHRRRSNEFLDEAVFEKLLADLQEIDYAEKISLVGLNEFFMHEENFAYLETAKTMLPKSYVTVYSNGDYITREAIERAEKAGLDLLIVSFHLQSGKPYRIEDVLDRAMKFSQRTGLQLVMTDFICGERIHFQAHTGGMHVSAGLVNFAEIGHNWGGSMDCGKEEASDGIPCQLPVNVLCLTHKGDFTLCCTVPREATPENIASGAMLGNIGDFPSLFHAYASDTMLRWRQNAFSTQHVPPLCQACSARSSIDNVKNRDLAAFVEQQHGYIKQPAAAKEAAA